MAGLTTLTADPHLLRAWRSGPRWYHVVVALIADEDVIGRRRTVARQLGDWVLPSAPEHPHVTLWTCGFDATPVLPATNDLTIRVGAPDTFRSAAYLRAAGSGIASIRRDLAAANRPEERPGPYVPHLTVGTYMRRVPIERVRRLLRSLPVQPEITVRADVRHMAVDTRSAVGALVPIDGN